MRTKNLVALLVLLVAICQLVTGQGAKSKAEKQITRSQSSQGKDAQNKDAPAKAQRAAKDTAEKPEIHEFVITNFKTESGITLPQARVVYGTYGHLNAARDNVVLLTIALHGGLPRI
jgi:homoserine acetyltransferase